MHLNSILYHRGSVNKTSTHSHTALFYIYIYIYISGLTYDIIIFVLLIKTKKIIYFFLNFPTFALPTYLSIKLHDIKVEHLKKNSQDILKKML